MSGYSKLKKFIDHYMCGGENNPFAAACAAAHFSRILLSKTRKMAATKPQQTEILRERQGRRGREMAEAVFGMMNLNLP